MILEVPSSTCTLCTSTASAYSELRLICFKELRQQHLGQSRSWVWLGSLPSWASSALSSVWSPTSAFWVMWTSQQVSSGDTFPHLLSVASAGDVSSMPCLTATWQLTFTGFLLYGCRGKIIWDWNQQAKWKSGNKQQVINSLSTGLPNFLPDEKAPFYSYLLFPAFLPNYPPNEPTSFLLHHSASDTVLQLLILSNALKLLYSPWTS